LQIEAGIHGNFFSFSECTKQIKTNLPNASVIEQ